MSQRYHYDEKSDSLFIWLKKGKEDSLEEIVPGVNVELDRRGNVIGVEILHVSRLFANEKRKKTSVPSKSPV